MGLNRTTILRRSLIPGIAFSGITAPYLNWDSTALSDSGIAIAEFVNWDSTALSDSGIAIAEFVNWDSTTLSDPL